MTKSMGVTCSAMLGGATFPLNGFVLADGEITVGRSPDFEYIELDFPGTVRVID